MNTKQLIKVWDPLIRLFHWTLVFSFLVAYLTEDEWLDLHVLAGYTITGLLVFRILWGFIGPQYARFSSFVTPISEMAAYARSLLTFNSKRYIGHNPLGGLAIILMITFLLMTVISGVLVYGAEGQGPLSMLFTQWGENELLEEFHEVSANLTVLLIVVHVSGVVLSSFMHQENLVKSMINGRKKA